MNSPAPAMPSALRNDPTPALGLSSTLAEIADACGQGLRLPTETGQVGHFAEPWQAQAFAMVVLLHQRGHFSWPEWAESLSAQIRLAQVAGEVDDGHAYYRHWLNALEAMVVARGMGSAAELQALAQAWTEAAAHTPHGQPIVLASGVRT